MSHTNINLNQRGYISTAQASQDFQTVQGEAHSELLGVALSRSLQPNWNNYRSEFMCLESIMVLFVDFSIQSHGYMLTPKIVINQCSSIMTAKGRHHHFPPAKQKGTVVERIIYVTYTYLKYPWKCRLCIWSINLHKLTIYTTCMP